ncbi:MAG TPA: DsbC family protein [Rhodanobacteraceae bacterium]|nr:DsbC family protein [Rhodanobacteraceae bacterium]
MIATLASLVVLVSSAAADAGSVPAGLREAAQRAHPGIAVNAVRPTASPELFEVDFGAGRVAHITRDGAFLVDGDLVRTADGENLTEASRATERAKVLAAIPRGNLISYPAKEKRYHVYVFTDVDCGYCRRLHQQIEQYNAYGISVDYVLYARGGEGSDTARKHRDVLCASNRAAALTAMKAGTPVSPGTCDAPIAALQAAGHAVGMAGTPGILSDAGTMLGGYLSPADLAVRLERDARQHLKNSQASR